MNKASTLLVALLLLAIYAQAGKKATTRDIKKVMTLKIDRPGGGNAAAVVWHPDLKRYYAAQAGNADFPLEIFDDKGTMVSDDNLTTMFDIRGLWYNKQRKTFQMNGYKDFGWAEYKLDSKGIPISVKRMPGATGQPDQNSGAAYDDENDVVYFLDYSEGSLARHQVLNSSPDAMIPVYKGSASKEEFEAHKKDEHPEVYNDLALVYTGIKGAEIGLLNVTSRRVELYDISTGFMTQILNLPDDATVVTTLDFSYCNGTYWLFHKEKRIWQGYK
jgi:hypothetical protein